MDASAHHDLESALAGFRMIGRSSCCSSHVVSFVASKGDYYALADDGLLRLEEGP